MAIKKGLGKGFDSLVPGGTNLNNVITPTNEKIHNLAIDIVKPKSNQPRRNFDEQLLYQLAQSIKEQGILQPIVVTETEHNIYSIIAGERRWRAAGLAGLSTIPAIIKKVDELQHLELALLENVQRSDLNAIETAISINRLHNEFQQSYEQIAMRLGKAYTTVVNTSRLLSLPKIMQESIASGVISEGHGRALLSLANNPFNQQKLFKNIVASKLSVRQAEEHAGKLKTNHKTKSSKVLTTSNLEQEISQYLGAEVRVSKSTKSGSITIKYKNNQQYQAILNIIKG